SGAGMTDAEIDAYAKGTNTYWADYFFREAQMNRQDLSISTGSENSASYTSISYLSQEGTYIASDYQRFGFRSNFKGKSENDKFHYSTNINGNFDRMNFDPHDEDAYRQIFFNPFMNAMQGSPLLTPYNPDGSVTMDGGLEVGDSQSLNKYNAPYVLLSQAHMDTHRTEQTRIVGNFHADWNFAPHLTAGVDVGLDLIHNKRRTILNPNSLLGPFQVNQDANFGGIDSESTYRDARFN